MESRQSQLPQFLIPLLFVALGAFGILTHEFWRDEAGPWLVIQSSSSIHDLIANLGYTGHTLTFFVWQYGLYKFFHTPVAGSIANLLFMTAAVWMFVRTSPFTNLQKWLFAFGFYPLYQYAVFNRMYAFLVFFLFAYCALYITKPHKSLLRWVMLIAMAETHMIGMLAAIPLATLDLTRTWGRGDNKRLETIFCGFKLLFFIFAITSVIWQLWPADQSYHSMNPSSPWLVFLGFADGFLPNFGFLYKSIPQIVIGNLLWLSTILLLWQHRAAFITYVMLLVPLALFSAIIYTGHRWHHGAYFMYWVIAIWISGAALLQDVRFRRWVTFLFALHAVMGLYALVHDGLHPYSTGSDMAHHIQEGGLSDLPIVGAEVIMDAHKGVLYKWEVDQIQPVMLALKGARIYNPRAGEWLTYWNHNDDKMYFPRRSLSEFEADLNEVAQKIGSPFMLIVATDPGLPEPPMPANLNLLYRGGRTIDYGEHLSVYRFSSKTPAP